MRTVSPLVEAGETSADRDEKRKVETLRFPQSFLERMEQQDPDYIQDDVDATIDRLLQQAVDIVKSDIIPSALRDGLINNCTAVWVFPRFLFARWLGYHSGNKSAIEESTGYHNAMIVNIGGLAPWVGGEIWLIPMLSHQNWDDTSEIRVATNTSTLSETLWYERGAFREASDTARASDKEGRYQKYLPPLGESDANLDLFLTELQAALDYMKRGPNAHRPESAVNLIYQPSDRSSVGGGDVTIDIIEPVEKPDSIRSGIKNGEVIVNVGPVN